MDKDFTGRNLRGRSFRGQNLSGARFRIADLRGADFTGADLRAADLSGARAGVGPRWAALVFLLALAASVLLGWVAGLGGRALQALIEDPQPRQRAIGLFLAIELAVFLLVFVIKGLRVAIRYVLPVAIALALVAGLIAIVSGVGTGSGALAALGFSVLLTAVVAFATVARAVAGTLNRWLFMVVALSGAAVGAVTGGGVFAAGVAIAGMLAAHRALHDQSISPAIGRLSITIACRGGTRFRNSDLSDATFEAARLRNSDFRGAVLERTRFRGSHIDLCAFDGGRSAPRTD